MTKTTKKSNQTTTRSLRDNVRKKPNFYSEDNVSKRKSPRQNLNNLNKLKSSKESTPPAISPRTHKKKNPLPVKVEDLDTIPEDKKEIAEIILRDINLKLQSAAFQPMKEVLK